MQLRTTKTGAAYVRARQVSIVCARMALTPTVRRKVDLPGHVGTGHQHALARSQADGVRHGVLKQWVDDVIELDGGARRAELRPCPHRERPPDTTQR